MRVWKHTPWDGLLVAFSVAQAAATFWMVTYWAHASDPERAGEFVALAGMMTYNIIVVSHLFTHVPWFASPQLNAMMSVLNSVNIGQSVQAYRLSHVRNHHRFNNDQKGEDGRTRDTSSTYLLGTNGQHASLRRYVLSGAFDSLLDRGRELAAVTRLWRVGPGERQLLALASSRERRRTAELRQVRTDRAAHCLSLVVFAILSWQWTLICYVPAFFTALAMVNVQNYYRHYGANPGNRMTDSVSHYGRLYNVLTFNDGFHQEHHLSPSTHWSEMPDLRGRYRARFSADPRIVSPVPAMLGFLHIGRPLLHQVEADRSATTGMAS
jgi:fatty acid desaturase